MKQARDWLKTVKAKNPSLSDDDDEILLGAYEAGFNACLKQVEKAYIKSEGDFDFVLFEIKQNLENYRR